MNMKPRRAADSFRNMNFAFTHANQAPPCVVGKSWDRHVWKTEEDNAQQAADTEVVYGVKSI
jgi:hypothetical protein